MTEYSPTPAAHSAASDDGGGTSVKDRATDASQAAKQAGTDVAQTAADKAKDVAHETSKQARDLLGEARGQVKEQAGTQHRALVEHLRSLADELSGMTSGNEQSGVATELVGQAGERVQGAADWLDGREPGDLLDEVRSFARRRPGTFLLGAALAGVLAGRLTRGVAAARSDDAGSEPKPPEPTRRSEAPAAADAPTTEFAPASDYETEVIGYSTPAADAPSVGYGTGSDSPYSSPQSGAGDGFTQPGQPGGGI